MEVNGFCILKCTFFFSEQMEDFRQKSNTSKFLFHTNHHSSGLATWKHEAISG